MKLVISPLSGEPIYEQIKRQIRGAVLDGDLKPGEALPSLRGLAHDLRVSVLTVTRAYNELAGEGVIYNVQGKGTFVSDNGSERTKSRLVGQVRAALRKASEASEVAGMTFDELTAMLRVEYDDTVSATNDKRERLTPEEDSVPGTQKGDGKQ